MVNFDYEAIQRARLPEVLKQEFIGNYLLYSDTLQTALRVRKEATARHGELVDMYHETQDPKVKRAMHATGKTIAKAMQQVDIAERMIISCEFGLEAIENHKRKIAA